MRKGIDSLLGLMVAIWGINLAPAAVPVPPLIVVAHADTPELSEELLQKIYLGKVVVIDGRSVIPVNLTKGSALRKDFMERILAQEDEKFVAYWTVRRYIGQGSPPREFSSVELQLEFIRATPGAVGYVGANIEGKPGLKTILRKP